MSLLRTAIGAVLRRLRLRQGRTLRDVADAAGVSMPYLSEIERGRKEASSEILAGICRALGIGLPDLLEEVRLELLRSVVGPRAALGGPVAGGAVAGGRSGLSAPVAGRRSDPRGPVAGRRPGLGGSSVGCRSALSGSAVSRRSALGRSAHGRDRGRSGFRTPRLAVCRTLSPTVSSSSTNF
jgi:DNA-binding Xre family transcriptional regulator